MSIPPAISLSPKAASRATTPVNETEGLDQAAELLYVSLEVMLTRSSPARLREHCLTMALVGFLSSSMSRKGRKDAFLVPMCLGESTCC
jgi:hypothetical protein